MTTPSSVSSDCQDEQAGAERLLAPCEEANIAIAWARLDAKVVLRISAVAARLMYGKLSDSKG